MIHTLQLGVAAPAALDFWAGRLAAAGVACERDDGTLRFADYDGLAFELVVAALGNPPLRAVHPEVPAEHALIGPRARARTGARPRAPAPLLTETLGFDALGEAGTGSPASTAASHWAYDDPPASPGARAPARSTTSPGPPRRGAAALAAARPRGRRAW